MEFQGDWKSGISRKCLKFYNMARQIRFQYQVKVPLPMFSMNDRERYEVRELLHKCDPNKSDKENLDDAFINACELGADPNKNVRWRFIES